MSNLGYALDTVKGTSSSAVYNVPDQTHINYGVSEAKYNTGTEKLIRKFPLSVISHLRPSYDEFCDQFHSAPDYDYLVSQV